MNLTGRSFCHHRELRDGVAGRDEKLLSAGKDPESVALSTELQARGEDNITLLESRGKLSIPIGFMIQVGIAQGKERIDTSYDRDKIFSWGEGEREQAPERN